MPRALGAQPHLLYVAWAFPPSRQAGMYRALATVNAFADAGWRVTVLTVTVETYERLTGTDPAMLDAVRPGVEVVRIPFDPARGEDDLARWSRFRVYSPLLWNAVRWVRASIGFPERAYASWLRPLVKTAEQLHRRDPVDLVIGTANPNVDLMPGAHLHRVAGVPYVIDHRDAWHLNVYTGARTAPRWSRSSRIERRLMNDALEAWFVNDPIRDWHRAEYPEAADRLHVVSNGFDPEYLRLPDHARPSAGSGLTFGYLGTIYGPIPLREALDGWREARRRSPLIARSRLVFRGRLGHFAEADQAAAELLAEYADDGVGYEGPVSRSHVASVYAGFDALLLIISRSRYVTSGKVYEYAATGLPIAALHHPETAATTVLDDHPATIAATEVEAAAFADVIVRTGEIAASWGDVEAARARAWAARLARDAQLRPRIEALTEAIAGGRP